MSSDSRLCICGQPVTDCAMFSARHCSDECYYADPEIAALTSDERIWQFLEVQEVLA